MRNTLFTILIFSLTWASSFSQIPASTTKIQFFCSRWGSESLSWDIFCKKVKEAGYDGVEAPFLADANSRQEAMEALKKYNLLYIGMVFYNPDPKFHLKDYGQQLRMASTMKPVH